MPTAVPIQVATPPAAPDNTQVLADTIAAMGGSPAAPADPNAPQTAATPPVQPSVMAPGEMSKTSVHTKVINPINDIAQAGSNLQELLAAEEAKEATVQAVSNATMPAAPAPSVPESDTPTPPPAPAASTVVVNDLTPPEVLQKQAEEAAEEAEETKLQPPTPIEPTT